MAKSNDHLATITTLDLDFLRPGFVSSHLIETPHGAALVDVGTASNATKLITELENRNIKSEDICYIFVTHIHLDHAGATGTLIQEYLPKAQVVVHKNGARHLINPAKLEAAAKEVYGTEYFNKHYGEIVPVAKERILIAEQDTVFEKLEPHGCSLDNRNFIALDTPGHARHHYSLWLKNESAVFTGDTFGVAYPVLQSNKERFIFPSTTPNAFNPEDLKQSIKKICATGCQSVYLTHFGKLNNVEVYAQQLLKRIDILTELTKSLDFEIMTNTHNNLQASGAAVRLLEEDLKNKIVKWLTSELSEFGYYNSQEILEQLTLDIQLNAQGLIAWYQR